MNAKIETLAKDLHEVFRRSSTAYIRSWDSISEDRKQAWLAVAKFVQEGSLQPTEVPGQPPVYLELGE